MNLRNIAVSTWVFFCFSSLSYAGYQADLEREVLRASLPDTSMTSYEKLFVYRCETVEKYLGFEDTAIGNAMKYSCNDAPQIGIALYVGSDLGDYPPEQIRKVFIERLDKEGLTAEVFIQKELEFGSAVIFFVNGESYLEDRVNPVEALKQIEVLSAEAKLMYIQSGQAEHWIKSK